MSDARGFMVAAYLLTVVTLLWYAILLVLRGRSVGRRLTTARDASRRSDPHHTAERDAELELAGEKHV